MPQQMNIPTTCKLDQDSSISMKEKYMFKEGIFFNAFDIHTCTFLMHLSMLSPRGRGAGDLTNLVCPTGGEVLTYRIGDW
jgi:hypothetical protein